ncbi:hypothetical protein BGW36DRAFT_386650 [Talaromyces proteolyticus]|uniref:Condensation domain-containing protein n=1 Tax=Talaromyces proteolyticus TaxID=1131652 RepID=A0AAD4KND7_9EURO|nr:uncharacterized protein BGW36DRAFT_386650 [Talaromyces proteolyticus]KAH8691970.1 hypothetical protein BGW36DRAFT_386650 [Talaromyces proteolyticus]
MTTTWTQTSDGHYMRAIGANEHFIKFVGDRAHPAGREQWSVTVTATMKIPDTISTIKYAEILRDAWKLLRFEHPNIASTAEEPEGFGAVLHYVVPNAAELDDWLSETLSIVEDSSLSPEDVIATLKPQKFVSLHFLPHHSQIILHTAHWRIDGYGAFYLLNAFFYAIKEILDNNGLPSLPWGNETARLVASLETALDLPEEDTQDVIDAARQYINTQILMKDSIGIPYIGDVNQKPGGTRSVTMEIAQDLTDSLEVASKQHGVGLFSACHAALAAIHFSSSSTPSNAIQHYGSTIRLNMRPYLLPPYNTSAGACSIYTGGYRLQVPSTQSFIDTAKQYWREYEEGVSEIFLRSRRQFALIILEGLRKGVPVANPPPSNIDISIVDNAEAILSSTLNTKAGPLEILNVNLGIETLTRQPYLFLWKFRGKLNLSLWYNEKYQDRKVALEALKSICQALTRGLGLKTQSE